MERFVDSITLPLSMPKLTEIGQTMPESPNISKVQACHFSVKVLKAVLLPITKLYPTVMLHEVSLRSATPVTHQVLQAKATAFVTPWTSEVGMRKEFGPF